MQIKPADLKEIAKLAHFNLSEKEIALIYPQINEILQFMKKNDEAEVSNTEKREKANLYIDSFRQDIVRPSINPAEFKKLAPVFTQGFFRVPGNR